MTRTEYLKLRASIRQNGLYALRWMDAHQAGLMLRIVRAPADNLALRADTARVERKHQNPKASRFALLVTQNVVAPDKVRHLF